MGWCDQQTTNKFLLTLLAADLHFQSHTTLRASNLPDVSMRSTQNIIPKMVYQSLPSNWWSCSVILLPGKTTCSRQPCRQVSESDCATTTDQMCSTYHDSSGCSTFCFHFMQRGNDGVISSWGKSVQHQGFEWSCADEYQWQCSANQRNWKAPSNAFCS